MKLPHILSPAPLAFLAFSFAGNHGTFLIPRIKMPRALKQPSCGDEAIAFVSPDHLDQPAHFFIFLGLGETDEQQEAIVGVFRGCVTTS